MGYGLRDMFCLKVCLKGEGEGKGKGGVVEDFEISRREGNGGGS